ncbi:ensconsin-like isoform X3 [Dinothrombium tinctorium]|uniref:Ensconsin-like isoform X3 n=1 Tax=Dinothrombium tinctorium TaxID=1965070 RepID=A0A3S3S828_9ACAR|nr:ensconsin-like isoform X3 [Dinothrombium tinctorium]RWS11770.1 ensconsin-like isoform X3 [Dinothrombium tinctorium]
MTRSLVWLPTFGRRHHPELVPVLPRDRDVFGTSMSSSARFADRSDEKKVTPKNGGHKRAISMTRLDQLSKPRQRYLEETLRTRNTAANSNSGENCMVCRSMYNLPTRSSSGLQASSKKGLSTTKERSLTSPTRPVSSLSGASEQSNSSSVRMRTHVARKPRPVSIAACASEKKTESSKEDKTSNKKTTESPQLRPTRAPSAGASPRLPLSQSDKDLKSSSPKPPPPRKPAHVKAAAAARKSAKQQQQTESEQKQQNQTPTKKPEKDIKQVSDKKIKSETKKAENVESSVESSVELNVETSAEIVNNDVDLKKNDEIKDETLGDLKQKSDEIVELKVDSKEENLDDSSLMTDSTTSLKKELTEEEYKKLMMEKRRLAREQAEKEAELRRQKEEEERKAEEERQRKLEEEQRLFEEEQKRLAEEYRKAEEEKLQKAIEEQKMREEEERKKREEETRLRLEREEQEMKAREEAERARIELEERLRKDEEERLARKKRVEAIMSRTRKTPGKNISPNSEGSHTPELQSNDSRNASPEKIREEKKSIDNILDLPNEEHVVITSVSHAKNSELNSELEKDKVLNQQQSSSYMNGKHTPPQTLSSLIQDAAVDSVSQFAAINSTSKTDSQLSADEDIIRNLNSSDNSSYDQLIANQSITSMNPSSNVIFDDKLRQNPDDVNSNIVHGNTFVAFEGQVTSAAMNIGNQEQKFTDLLS